MTLWIDPRTNPEPSYQGTPRPLAGDEADLSGLIAACRAGRFYEVKDWIRAGRPLQIDPDAPPRAGIPGP